MVLKTSFEELIVIGPDRTDKNGRAIAHARFYGLRQHVASRSFVLWLLLARAIECLMSNRCLPAY
jgi:hypothetical protein